MAINKPIKKYIFRPIEGIWQNVSGDSEILADILERYGLEIDERTQFARIKDYYKGEMYLYKAQALVITLEVWKIHNIQ